MKIGTKSLLFGVHQFIWHPLIVALAWRRLYRCWPNRAELVAIFFHDTGYWGCPNIDGEEGRQHPSGGALNATAFCRAFAWPVKEREEAFHLALCHSREFAKMCGGEPSALCWPDKYCIFFEPKWFYLFRGWLSGELAEFRQVAIDTGHLPDGVSYSQWFDWYRRKVKSLPEIQRLLLLRKSQELFA